MRQLPDRGAAPACLLENACVALVAVSQAVEARRFPLQFRSAIYGSEGVRNVLHQRQSGKCAFCEVQILPVSTPHVEHYRPKGGYIDEETGLLQQPGYYWLAYAWSNLALACPRCNGKSFKGNRFPLEVEASRALHPDDDISLESPLLINPYDEDPREHIRFRGGVAYAVNGSARGQKSIDVYGINREDLVDSRESYLNKYLKLRRAVRSMPAGQDRDDVEDILREMRSNSGPFSSCIQDAPSEE